MAVRKKDFDDEHLNNSDGDSLAQFGISPELRQRIKQAADESNLSVREYLEQVLEKNVHQEEDIFDSKKQPLTQEKLAQILQISEQIMQHTQGQIFEDPAEVIRKMREERLEELG